MDRRNKERRTFLERRSEYDYDIVIPERRSVMTKDRRSYFRRSKKSLGFDSKEITVNLQPIQKFVNFNKNEFHRRLEKYSQV